MVLILLIRHKIYYFTGRKVFMSEVGGIITGEYGLRTEVFSNKELIIEGKIKVSDYGENFVCLKSGRMSLIIKGRGLKIVSLKENALSLKGSIHSLEYCFV